MLGEGQTIIRVVRACPAFGRPGSTRPRGIHRASRLGHPVTISHAGKDSVAMAAMAISSMTTSMRMTTITTITIITATMAMTSMTMTNTTTAAADGTGTDVGTAVLTTSRKSNNLGSLRFARAKVQYL